MEVHLIIENAQVIHDSAETACTDTSDVFMDVLSEYRKDSELLISVSIADLLEDPK